MGELYTSLGASASKAGLHQALVGAGLETHSGLFAPVLPDVAGDPSYSSFLHADGAGTKTIVAYLRYRESGDPEVFAGLAQDALVMNLDDVFCIGSPESMLLSNAIARNSKLIDDTVLEVLLRSYRSLREQLSTLGIDFALAGGETADCGDVVRTLIVDAVLFGRIRNSGLIRATNIAAGDLIVGLSSTGQAKYEQTPNSGVGSNGLTLARHSLLSRKQAAKYPEVLDPGLDEKIAYRGPFGVNDRPAELGMTVGEALGSPTRTYAPILKAAYAELGSQVHGVIHLTGGGQTKPLRFGKGLRFVKDSLFPTPPLFSLIQAHGQVGWKEMYQVFNMGHRMELYLPEGSVPRLIAISEAFGVEAKVIGRVEPQTVALGERNSLELVSPHGRFEY
ncbi:MAG: AIR synthase-related protein [Bdellovibrionota bacterium]